MRVIFALLIALVGVNVALSIINSPFVEKLQERNESLEKLSQDL